MGLSDFKPHNLILSNYTTYPPNIYRLILQCFSWDKTTSRSEAVSNALLCSLKSIRFEGRMGEGGESTYVEFVDINVLKILPGKIEKVEEQVEERKQKE